MEELFWDALAGKSCVTLHSLPVVEVYGCMVSSCDDDVVVLLCEEGV